MSATVTSDRFGAPAFAGIRVELPTPEGVPLCLTVATMGERVVAFARDGIRFALVAGLTVLLTYLAVAGGGGGIIGAVALLTIFLLRNGWFLFFELRSNGRTPGKRATRIRVVDARGGPLRPMSVVVRNLTREVELFLPLQVLAAPEALVDTGPSWLQSLSVLWVLAFALVPWLDRRNRRVGDLLGGTLVVREPRQRLLADLAAEPRQGVHLDFTSAQLGHYGIYELQVLERLLRDEPAGSPKLQTVAQRIAKKIGWRGPLQAVGSRAFLDAFYKAQRARLEHDLTLGRARERKHAKGGPPRD